MKILVVDVGGTHVKVLATGRTKPIKIPSGPTMTARQMVRLVRKAVAGWEYSVVSVGYPGAVLRGKPVSEPRNLGSGWLGFNFTKAFGCPVKLILDYPVVSADHYMLRLAALEE